MKRFEWSDEKNAWLKRVRAITFEEIVYHLSEGDLLDVLEHPNQERYPGQRIFVVNVQGYAFVVPFVEHDEVIFLKTVIPSRKMTRQYLEGKER